MAFYLLVWLRLERNSNIENSNSSEPPLSVIISAKNEFENLKQNLPKILTQSYRDFEVIIVNHGNDLSTCDFLSDLSARHENLKFLNLPLEVYPNKKSALAKGIDLSSHDLLLFTDADCYPQTDNWLKHTAEEIHQKEILIGYGKYERKDSFLNAIIRYDTFHIALSYFMLASLGLAYMAVGRNLAYRKNLFYRVNGFDSHKNVLSGDDDLFIQEASTKTNTAICLNSSHHTISAPKETFREFFIQKRRHQTTGFYYRFLYSLILSLLSFGFVGFWIFFFFQLILIDFFSVVFTLFFMKILVQYLCYWKISKTLGEKDLWLLAPILEIIVVLYNVLVGLSLLISKQTKWK